MRIEDIVNKVFTRSFMGYDIEQVDLFLDEIIERFEKYEAEKKEMLIAMEYLLNKLEHDEKLPITEMRKAIDSGKSQKKRPSQKEQDAEGGNSRSKNTEAQEESISPAQIKQAARSIARSAQAPKPIRTPKVSRVRPEQEEAATQAPAPKQDTTKTSENTNDDAPSVGYWLDELLINLIEREKIGYGEPLKGVEPLICDNGDVSPASDEKRESNLMADGDVRDNGKHARVPDEGSEV